MEIKDIINESLSYIPPFENHFEIAYTSHLCSNLYQAYKSKKINYDKSNFYVLSPESDIDRIAKISTLMPSTITFTNLNRYITQINHGIWWDKNGYIDYEVLCHLPNKELFDKCGKLFSEGIIQYYPNIAYYIINPDGSEELSKKDTIEHPCGIVDATTDDIKMNLLDCVLSLDIPYISEISISDFSDIAINNMDALNNFKRLFKKEILNLNFSKTNEKADFEYTLNSEVNKIGEKYKKDCSILRKNIVIGTVSTVATSLLVFPDINALMKCIIGLNGGKGLIKVIESIYDFHIEKATTKNKDFYFLWLIKKFAKK